MNTNSARGGGPGDSGESSPEDRLRRRIAELEADLSHATLRCESVERVLADERVQLARTFELFERDRRFLGFEIHDGIVQDLTAVLMYLQVAVADLQKRPDPVPASLTDCERILGDCIHEARRLMNGLQPPLLSERGLRPALEALVEEVRARGVPELALAVPEQLGTLAPPLEITVFRIVQESLNNVWQHSQARRASVRICLNAEQIEITVTDHGVGFLADDVKRHCYGLAGIRERAALFGGQATIDSRPGTGTTVRAVLPLV